MNDLNKIKSYINNKKYRRPYYYFFPKNEIKENNYIKNRLSMVLEESKTDLPTYIQTLELYRNYITNQEELKKILVNTIDVFIKHKAYDKLLETYKELISLESDNDTLVSYYRDISNILQNNFELEDAVLYINKAIGLISMYCSNLQSLYIRKSMILFNLKRHREAVASIEDIIEKGIRCNQDISNIYMFYLLLVLAVEENTFNIREHLQFQKSRIPDFCDHKNYTFLLNIISSFENCDLPHYQYEVSHFTKCDFYSKNENELNTIFRTINSKLTAKFYSLNYAPSIRNGLLEQKESSPQTPSPIGCSKRIPIRS